MAIPKQGTLEDRIELVLQEINRNRILNEEEQDQIRDHFYCEIEDLESKGLIAEEALLVAKRRFGHVELINEEFQKVKFGSRFYRLGILLVVSICVAHLSMIAVNEIYNVFWMFMSYIRPEYLTADAMKLSFNLKIILYVVSAFFGARIVLKFGQKPGNTFWVFPILYVLFSFVSKLLFVFYSIHTVDNEWLFYSLGITNTAIGKIFIFITTMVIMFSLRKLECWRLRAA